MNENPAYPNHQPHVPQHAAVTPPPPPTPAPPPQAPQPAAMPYGTAPGYPAPQQGPNNSTGRVVAAVLVAISLIAGAVGVGWYVGNDDAGEAQAGSGGGERASLTQPFEQTQDDGGANNPQNPPNGGEDNAPSGRPEGPISAAALERVQDATVQVQATGEFVSTDGVVEGVGRGTGFIINADGLAVTNNHVVAGASFLEVFVPGEDRPRTARVIAVAECSDLAVIDIEGGNLPTLGLTMEPLTLGTEIWAAGYPLGNPEFTLTRGIVSKANADGNTQFAAVASVVEHDATINPGNSGGPLVDAAGDVVGINYQVNPSARQSFAISAPDAQELIDQLSQGNSVDSIGISGEIIPLDDRLGLFVEAVSSNSAADNAGLLAGDVIFETNNIAVSEDGTMRRFCSTIRANGADAEMDLAVFRPSTGEVLRGTVNGAGLTPLFNGSEVMADAGMEAPQQSAPNAMMSGEFELVSDATGTVNVELPTRWNERDGSGLEADGVSLPSLVAAEDFNGFVNGFTSGGAEIVAIPSDRFSYDETWAAFDGLAAQCNMPNDPQDVSAGGVAGTVQVAMDCGGTGASLVLFQFEQPGTGLYLRGAIQVLTADDVTAAERILATVLIR